MVLVPSGGGGWVAPQEAVLPDLQCRQQPDLAAALLAAGLLLAVDVPDAVVTAMLE